MSDPAESRAVPWALIALPVLVLTFFFAVPNVILLSASFLRSDAQMLTDEFTLENYAFFFERPQYLWALGRTVMIGFMVGLVDVVLAFPIAYFLTRMRSRWSGLFLAVALAPLLASVVVRTFGWYIILERDGIVSRTLEGIGLTDGPSSIMPGSPAIIIGLAHALLPYAIITIMGSLKGINPSLESAAMSLGAGRLRTLVTVLLPLSLPGIAGGFLLAFTSSISAYATPMILGGPGTATIATLIYDFMMVILDWSISAMLGVVLLVTTLGLLFLSSKLGNRQIKL